MTCCTVGCGAFANVLILAPDENMILLACHQCGYRARSQGYNTRDLPARKGK